MNFAPLLTLIYGILILIGGIMGHLKAGSRISLYTGIVFGFLLILSSIGLYKGMKIGAYGSLFLALILLCFFSWRFIHTANFFPSGMMGIISLVVLTLLAISFKRTYL